MRFRLFSWSYHCGKIHKCNCNKSHILCVLKSIFFFVNMARQWRVVTVKPELKFLKGRFRLFGFTWNRCHHYYFNIISSYTTATEDSRTIFIHVRNPWLYILMLSYFLRCRSNFSMGLHAFDIQFHAYLSLA